MKCQVDCAAPPTANADILYTGDEYTSQAGVVQLYQIINGQVDVSRPLMTLTGDREFARFGTNVIVSSSHGIF